MDKVLSNNSWSTAVDSQYEIKDYSKASLLEISDLSECSFKIDAFKNHENSLDFLNATDEIQIEQNDENHLLEKKILDQTVTNDSDYWVAEDDKSC